MGQIDIKLEEQFVQHYLDRIIERGRGTGPEGAVCVRTRPQRTYFIGGLAAKNQDDSADRRRIAERYNPNSCGLEFRIHDRTGWLQLECAFSLYVLCYAPFETLRRESSGSLRAARYYRRYRVTYSTDPVELRILLEDPSAYSTQWTAELNKLIAEQLEKAAEDPYTVRVDPGKGKSIEDTELPQIVLESEEKYLAHLPGVGKGPVFAPKWEVALTLEGRQDRTAERIRVFLQNLTVNPGVDQPDLDGGIYGVDLVCRCIGFEPVPIALHRSARTDYRYQFTRHGRGINCSLREERLPGGGLLLAADFAPTYWQRRYLPEDKGYQLHFASLATDPLRILRPIAEGMRRYAHEWAGRISRHEDGITTSADEAQARQYLEKFWHEIERFEAGITCLEGTDDLSVKLREAFKLMNETFEQLDQWRGQRKGKRFYGWRLFQLVFIVSNLPDLLERARGGGHDAPAELLYFPTGGGKTEAVMGVVVTALFFDRLRGRKRGVTSWMRFPLRLLTFQQMQRYLDITVAADVVRARATTRFPALAKGDGFQIGYYGGRDNSPNDLYHFDSDSQWAVKVAQELSAQVGYRVEPSRVTAFEVLVRHPEAFARYRMVGDCPYCGTEDSVEVVADKIAIALRHRCKKCGQTLPLLIVDTDIYAEVPSLLVGTLDKIANIGFRLGARTLFGKADGRCKKHGYGTFGKCLKSRFGACSHKDWVPLSADEMVDPGISIIFQDELHLLNEELGCFDAHYEAVLDALCESAGSPKPKVLCASATIEGAENQVDHLYRRRLERFPGEGPQLRETFYAKEQDKLQRIFCGLKPSGMQPLDMTMALVATLALENDLLRNRRAEAQTIYGYGFLAALSDDEYQTLVDRHCLLVPYVNSKPDGAEIERSISEQVQDILERNAASPLAPPEMLTGDTEMPEVKSILRRMETPQHMASPDDRLDVVIATSMISHGVDVDRLNQMLFYSFPRSTAEYIQASSRVGRTYPGLVFVVLKASSQRDRSYFRHFAEVHYALDQMVEAVPIDRFAANAADRTIPGVALAWLIGAAADELRKKGKLSLSDARELDVATTLRRFVATSGALISCTKEALERIYEVTDPRGAQFAATITRKLEALEANLARVPENARSIPSALNTTSTRVMTSLRDVDPGVEIAIENRVQRR